MSFGDELADLLHDHVLGGADYPRPATVYVALGTGSMKTSTDNEVSGNAYARVAVTNNATNWPASSTGSKSNGAAITFPQATAAWGTMTHVAVFDAATDGVLLFEGVMDPAWPVGQGDTPEFAIGELTNVFDS